MRILLLGLALSVAAGCGGSSTSNGTGGGGGSAGAGATGGGGSSPADASTDGGFSQCFDSAGKFIGSYDFKMCGGAGECSMVAHQTDCCGSILLIGVVSGYLKTLQACEKAWRATLPACQCDAKPLEIEQGTSTVTDPSQAAAQCDNFTSQGGICLSEQK